MRWRGIGMVCAGLALATGVAAQDVAPLPEWEQERLARSQDPADELYREARRALAREAYQDAARLFNELRTRHPRSAYAGDTYYFEALARYRDASSGNLDVARELLSEQARLFPGAATREDARTLAARINAAAARRGDVEATREVRRQAQQSCEEEGNGVRSAALSALLNMDSERAIPILREVLAERGECSVELRRQAVFLIAQHMDDETVGVLLDLAHRNPDPDPEVREAAVFWLSQVDDPAALDALMEILESGEADEEVQEKALFAVGQVSSPEARQVLEGYARRADAPMELRESAIFWLGQRRGSLTFLQDLYGTLTEPELREKVLFAVSQSGDASRVRWLLDRAADTSEELEVRENALFWAGQAGAPPSELVRVYRTAQDPELREQAIFVLSQARGDQATAAVDALMEIARTEEDAELKERAVFWLGQSRDPRVAEFLLELIRGG